MTDHEREDIMFLLQNITPEETASLIVTRCRMVQCHFFPCTFSLDIGEDGLVLLHDVGKEESFAHLTLWLDAAAQVSPEGGFEGEVPWSWDAIFS